MTPTERKALDEFVTAVRARYGARLVDIFVFGSRARGDATEDSDVDLAIVLEDGEWTFWNEKRQFADLVHDTLIDHGLYIQALPIRRSSWLDPSTHANPRFLRAIKHDARPVAEVA